MGAAVKRILIGVLVVLVLTGAAAILARGALAEAAMSRLVARNLSSDVIAELPDGLHAFVCGSGSPLADPDRSGPCLAVIAGERLYVVDAGEGAAETLTLGRLPPARVERVFLTHFHSDHIDGLGALALQRWAGGAASTPLPLSGPAGVEQVAEGFNLAYGPDRGYRVAHHGPAVVPPEGFGLAAQPFSPPPPGQTLTVFEADGLRVTAFAVDHSPVSPAVGYRFDYKGRSIVVSGDTARSPSLAAAAKGADLLVHEALSPRLVGLMQKAAVEAGRPNLAKVFADIPDYHSTPGEAADTARAAGVQALLLTHLVPPLRIGALRGPFLDGARRRFDGQLWIARDGDLVSLPADGREIRRRRSR